MNTSRLGLIVPLEGFSPESRRALGPSDVVPTREPWQIPSESILTPPCLPGDDVHHPAVAHGQVQWHCGVTSESCDQGGFYSRPQDLGSYGGCGAAAGGRQRVTRKIAQGGQEQIRESRWVSEWVGGIGRSSEEQREGDEQQGEGKAKGEDRQCIMKVGGEGGGEGGGGGGGAERREWTG